MLCQVRLYRQWLYSRPNTALDRVRSTDWATGEWRFHFPIPNCYWLKVRGNRSQWYRYFYIDCRLPLISIVYAFTRFIVLLSKLSWNKWKIVVGSVHAWSYMVHVKRWIYGSLVSSGDYRLICMTRLASCTSDRNVWFRMKTFAERYGPLGHLHVNYISDSKSLKWTDK